MIFPEKKVCEKLLTNFKSPTNIVSSISTELPDTPMMAQWHSCKQAAPDALLLFRLGEFYEAFQEDASILSKDLEIVLTHRQNIPMAGVPATGLEAALDKLLQKGHRVAIAEQIEESRGKGLMRREIVRIVSPGTLIQGSLLQEKHSNWLLAAAPIEGMWGMARIELSTGSVFCCELPDFESFLQEVGRIRPSEILLPERWAARDLEFLDRLKGSWMMAITLRPDTDFDRITCQDLAERRYGCRHWEGLGLRDLPAACIATGAALRYVEQLFPGAATTMSIPQLEESEARLFMDRTTLRHLGLFEDAQQNRSMTLVGILDQTCTSMGGRLLQEWIQRPLSCAERIGERYDALTQLLQKPLFLSSYRNCLKEIRDLDRIATRLASGLGSPRDFLILKESLHSVQSLYDLLPIFPSSLLDRAREELPPPHEWLSLLDQAIAKDPPLKAGEGGCFRLGFDQDYDRFTSLVQDRTGWLDAYQQQLRSETGLRSLKIGSHQSLGYYIEVSKGQASSLPSHFVRRQTLTHAERFTTEALDAFEQDAVMASEQLRRRELFLLQQLRELLHQQLPSLRRISRSVALLDLLCSLATVAYQNSWQRPEIVQEDLLDISAGRHPVLEQALPLGAFIPNDVLITARRRMMILTGPNMGGKSTYMRQVGLLVILAQMGSFVPAKRMRFGLVDRIFTRIGASDDLVRGQSTFMVEMLETASILHQATRRSLVLLDEIGRGTSTTDGLAIAWAVAEFLLQDPSKGCKTLFATHFLELAQLPSQHPTAFNAHVVVEEQEGHLTFLHRLRGGAADRAYGLHVARLAGLPAQVVQRAFDLQQNFDRQLQKRFLQPSRESVPTTHSQPTLFEV